MLIHMTVVKDDCNRLKAEHHKPAHSLDRARAQMDE